MTMRHGSRLRNPKPGEVVAAGLLATGLSASAVLVALGHDPVSTCVRSSWPLRGKEYRVAEGAVA